LKGASGVLAAETGKWRVDCVQRDGVSVDCVWTELLDWRMGVVDLRYDFETLGQ